MKRYERYIKVDLQWLEEVPEHWGLHKIKYVFTERSEKGYPNEKLLAATQNHGVIPKDLYENRTVLAMKGLETLKLVKIGDFVISLRSFEGGIEYAYYQGIISPAYTVIHSNQTLEDQYFKYLGKSFPFIQLLQLCVTGIREGQNINYGLLKNKKIPVPPKFDQEKIAAFLDYKIDKINQAINREEKKKEKINKLKQSIIADVVTEGLNSQVKVKDVELEWLKKIPQHWGLSKIKNIFKERSEKGYPNEKLLAATQNHGVIPKDLYENRTVLAIKGLETLKLVKIGDFVISLRSFEGGIEYAYYQGIISPAYTVIYISKYLEDRYFKYLAKSFPFIQLLQLCVTGIREGQNINYSLLKNKKIPLPPKSEQRKIADFLEDIISKIDKLLELEERKIDKLESLKQSLISEVVTGQIDVRDFEIPEEG